MRCATRGLTALARSVSKSQWETFALAGSGRQVRWCSDKQQAADKQAAEAETETKDAPKEAEEDHLADTKTLLEEREAHISNLETANESLEEQLKELKNAYLTCKADQENTRRIAQRDIDNAKKRALKNFAKDLLEVVDNFERSVKNTPEDVKAEDSPLFPLFQGVQMTENILFKVLRKHGVEKMDITVRETEFDANWHDAITQVVVEGLREELISDVLKTGFTLNGEVLRAANVVVTLRDPALPEDAE